MLEKLTSTICVVGGGPAGSVAATRLAALGHKVVLVTRSRVRSWSHQQSLPAAVLSLLAPVGLRDAVERAGFGRSTRTQLRWDSSTTTIFDRQSDPPIIVDRGHFDELLLQGACDSGVRVIRTQAAVRPSTDHRGGWSFTAEDGINGVHVEALYLIDAAGRAGCVPTKRRLTAPATLALCGTFYAALGRPGETFVQACPHHWMWGVQVDERTCSISVFVDPAAIRHRGRIASLLRSFCAQGNLFVTASQAKQLGTVLARSATSHVVDRPVQKRCVYVGEAAVAVDPISSQGVALAITSGLQAALVVHTYLTKPRFADVARSFYFARVCDVARHSIDATREAYSRAAAVHRTRFWQARVAAAGEVANPKTEALPSAPQIGVDPGVLPQARDPTALAEVKPNSILALGSETRFIRAPGVVGDLIAPVLSVAHPRLARPIAYVADVPVASLLLAFGSGTAVRDAAHRLGTSATPARWDQILLWALNLGLLTCCTHEKLSNVNVPDEREFCDAEMWA